MANLNTLISGILSFSLFGGSCIASANYSLRSKRYHRGKSSFSRRNLINDKIKSDFMGSSDNILLSKESIPEKSKVDKNNVDKFVSFSQKIGKLISNNPGKTTGAVFSAGYFTSLLVSKISDSLADDNVTLKALESWIKKSKYAELKDADEFENQTGLSKCLEENENLKYLYCMCREFRDRLKSNGINPTVNYSLFRTAYRRFKDASLFRSAVVRERKSVERYLKTEKGTCWEAAQIFDFYCRMKKIPQHNIVVSTLMPGIYHSFNFITLEDGNSYLCDPLNGLFQQVIKDGNGSVHDFISNYITFALKKGMQVGEDYFQGYILEQINDDTHKNLGSLKMANFLSTGTTILFINEESKPKGMVSRTTEINDDGDFLKYDNSHGLGKIIFNNKDNVKFNKRSTFLFG